MTMKEKVDSILGGFLERNKDYAISGNISNGISGNHISDFWMTIDRQFGSNESVLYLKSNIGDIKSVNHILISYDEVLDCYEERDEYNQQMVYVILKNGMRIDFECVGVRIWKNRKVLFRLILEWFHKIKLKNHSDIRRKVSTKYNIIITII